MPLYWGSWTEVVGDTGGLFTQRGWPLLEPPEYFIEPLALFLPSAQEKSSFYPQV